MIKHEFTGKASVGGTVRKQPGLAVHGDPDQEQDLKRRQEGRFQGVCSSLECKSRKCKTEVVELLVGAAHQALTQFFRKGSWGHSILQAPDPQGNPFSPQAYNHGSCPIERAVIL